MTFLGSLGSLMVVPEPIPRLSFHFLRLSSFWSKERIVSKCDNMVSVDVKAFQGRSAASGWKHGSETDPSEESPSKLILMDGKRRFGISFVAVLVE